MNNSNFDMTPLNFSQTPTKFGQTPTKLAQTPSKFAQTPTKFGKTPSKFDKTPSKFDKTPSKFDKTPSKFDKTPSKFDKTPSNSFVPRREDSSQPPAINPHFMPQVMFGAPSPMPQYFSNSPFMPYSNIFNHPLNPMICPVQSQPYSDSFAFSQNSFNSVKSSTQEHEASFLAFSQNSFNPVKSSIQEHEASFLAYSQNSFNPVKSSTQEHKASFLEVSQPGPSKRSTDCDENRSPNTAVVPEKDSCRALKDITEVNITNEVVNRQKVVNDPPEMRLLIGPVEQVLDWYKKNKKIHSTQVLVQLIGVFVRVLKSTEFEHLLLVRGTKPDSRSMQVVYYSIDRPLPSFLPNQIILCTGHLKGSRKLQAFDFEKLSPTILSKLQRITQFCNLAVQDMS